MGVLVLAWFTFACLVEWGILRGKFLVILNLQRQLIFRVYRQLEQVYRQLVLL